MSEEARPRARARLAAACALALLALAATPPKSGPEQRGPAKGAGPAPAAPAPADTMKLRTLVRTLASPAWEGRGIGTAGIDSAADWIASQLQQAGFRPGGDGGTWFQTLEVTTGVVPEAPCELKTGGATFPLGEALQPLGFSSNGSVRARLVFAGYGITAPGYGWDDYAGIDARDAIVLVLTQEPGELDSTSRFDGSYNTPFADLHTKAINAREHGALGLLVVNGPRWHAGEPPRAPAREGEGYFSSGLLAAWIGEAAADALLKPAGLDLLHAQAAIESTGLPHSLAIPDSATLTVNVKRSRATTRNVVGMLAGRDTARTLVLGAHYDHLGYGGPASLAPDARAPHVGADDNASGVAAILAAAQRLGAKQRRGWRPRHTIVVSAFTGEEMGLVGSDHFVGGPPRPIETVEAMVNLDMVGRLRDGRLQVSGVGTAAEFPALVQNANAKVADARFDLRTSEDGYGPSDHQSFYKRGVPVLSLFTGAHSDYHKPSDTWDKLSYTGLARVSDFAQALIESLDVRPRPTFAKAKASGSPGRIAGGGGYGAWLGTVPNYMQTEGGVLLDDVRDGSPAQKAGLRGGDVIVRFDGLRVDNIYDYTFGLRTRKPGQEVRITVKRDGKDVELMATLGRRD